MSRNVPNDRDRVESTPCASSTKSKPDSRGEPLTIVGDGEQRRDFTYVSDAVDAFVRAAESARVGGSYNVGGDHPISINKLVKRLGARSTVSIPKRPGEPDCTRADTTRIKAELGLRPAVPVAEGVRRMLAEIDYWRDPPVWKSIANGGQA